MRETDYEVQMQDNGVFRKPRHKIHSALTPSEQLRLIYRTGDTDPKRSYDDGQTFRGEDRDRKPIKPRRSKATGELI